MSASTYRGWSVNFDPKPIPIRDFDWTATHPDYDASYEGEEDGWTDNGLKASAATYPILCDEIDALQDDLDAESADDARMLAEERAEYGDYLLEQKRDRELDAMLDRQS